MKTFKEFNAQIEDDCEVLSREDKMNLVETLVESDQEFIMDLVMEMLTEDIDEEDIFEGEITINEKMSSDAKKQAAKLRKTASFKKASKLKAKCQKKNAKRLASNDKLTCSNEGKIIDAMSKEDKKELLKTRNRNKSKIVQ